MITVTYKKKTAEEKQKEIEALTKDMKEKVNNFYESEENIVEHLQFMSQFYDYSVRNQLLIQQQFSGAKAVGSFAFWKSKGATVKKGEKGIKILVPVKTEKFKRDEKWIAVKYANVQETAQIKNKQLEVKKFLSYKIGHVFDYMQTDAREKGLEVSEIFSRHHLDHDIENSAAFLKACEALAKKIGVKISKESIEELGHAKGAYYHFPLNVIALNQRNTVADNVLTLIHELAHAKMHNIAEANYKLPTSAKEYQAEMTAYVVSSHFDIAAENSSLAYIANWSKELSDKEKDILLNEVRSTSKEFIDVLEDAFEKELQLDQSYDNLHLIRYDKQQALVEKVESKNALVSLLEKYVPDFSINDFNDQSFNSDKSLRKYINDTYKEHIFLHKQEDDKAYLLIQGNSTLFDYATANSLIQHYESNLVNENKKETLTYHVLMPKDDALEVVSATKVINDHTYENTFQQLISEKLVTKEQQHILLNTFAIDKESMQSLDERVTENKMIVHNYNSDLHDFSELNKVIADSNLKNVKYTLLMPDDDVTFTYSNSYNANEFASPLAQLKADNNFSKSRYAVLEDEYNNYLSKEDDKLMTRMLEQMHSPAKFVVQEKEFDR